MDILENGHADLRIQNKELKTEIANIKRTVILIGAVLGSIFSAAIAIYKLFN